MPIGHPPQGCDQDANDVFPFDQRLGPNQGPGANPNVTAAAMMKSAAHRRPKRSEAMSHIRLIHPDLDCRMEVRLRKLDGRLPAVAGSVRCG
jgi:hypothetical protein